MAYKTSDGKEFYSVVDQLNHQKDIDTEKARLDRQYSSQPSSGSITSTNLSRNAGYLGQIEDLFNKGNWDAVINSYKKAESVGHATTSNTLFCYWTAIAYANRDNDIKFALKEAKWGNPVDFFGKPLPEGEVKTRFNNLMDAVKKAFKRENGREMTENDLLEMRKLYDEDYISSTGKSGGGKKVLIIVIIALVAIIVIYKVLEYFGIIKF